MINLGEKENLNPNQSNIKKIICVYLRSSAVKNLTVDNLFLECVYRTLLL